MKKRRGPFRSQAGRRRPVPHGEGDEGPRSRRHGPARWISKFGWMSRSEAERAVFAGRVTVNGKVVIDPERPCDPEHDRIVVDGRPLRPMKRIYVAMNKPAGVITTAKDPEGRPTVYDLLPPGMAHVQAVGRLDADTSGLLLFTNDTDFAARVTDSAGGVEKVYEAHIRGRVRPEEARRFERGIELDGKMTLPARCRILESTDGETHVEMKIIEGRNRQIRRMWEALGHEVIALKRTQVGAICLGGLPPGRTRPVSEFERSTIIVMDLPKSPTKLP